jgi:hypothetical protein
MILTSRSVLRLENLPGNDTRNVTPAVDTEHDAASALPRRIIGQPHSDERSPHKDTTQTYMRKSIAELVVSAGRHDDAAHNAKGEAKDSVQRAFLEVVAGVHDDEKAHDASVEEITVSNHLSGAEERDMTATHTMKGGTLIKVASLPLYPNP